jgi:DNA repair protein RadD
MTMRGYQQRIHDSIWAHIKTSVSPCLIEAEGASGKSHIIAAIAKTIHTATSKKVLCLAPSAELVTQNREKFTASGHKASMFSASAGAKDLRHNVVFGSPLTVKNRISRFQSGYAAVVIDECHMITPTIKGIIEAMREGNPMLRVIGFTATPYRLGSGYIYRQGHDGRINGEDTARDPYFDIMVDQILGPELIEAGYLTPPVVGDPAEHGYDTSALVVGNTGKAFNATDVDRAYVGHDRKTSAIVAEVVSKSVNSTGVMIFAATVQHANEVMASLPPEISAMVTATTSKGLRRSTIERTRSGDIKYLVSVGSLTTGVDIPRIDTIVLMRKTESVSLLRQIILRGARLFPGKQFFAILDYADNISTHFPDGDLFAPEVKAGKEGGEGKLKAECPVCQYENRFSTNIKHVDYDKDAHGYCLDLDGNQVKTDYGPLPGHHGRRCMGQEKTGPLGTYERCGYRWTSKECPECLEHNDIAARYCCNCKAEIVDPNEKLKMDFKRTKRTPTEMQTDKVVSMTVRDGVSQRGNRTVRADFVTPWRSFSVWFTPDSHYSRQQGEYAAFCKATELGDPNTITYRKDAATSFYSVFGYNREADHAPE